MHALSVKNKLSFINGECRKPPPNSPLCRQWERCDDMVTSWILNSLSKEIADSVEYVCDSLELWSELSDRYDQTNGAKLYQIQQEINDLSQGTLDVTGYYTKLKKLWEELNNLIFKHDCTRVCTCGAKDFMLKAEQDRRLIQFLMGLNEIYTVIRGSILMMNPLPSIGQAFALLVQEEKQREIKPHQQFFGESTSLNASISGVTQFKTNYATTHPSHSANTFPGCFVIFVRSLVTPRRGAINSMVIHKNNFHRFKTTTTNQHKVTILSHMDTTLTGFSNYKGKAVAANAAHNVTSELGQGSVMSHKEASNFGLSKEQYGQIASLLTQFQMNNAENNLDNVNHTQLPSGAAHFAGILACNS